MSGFSIRHWHPSPSWVSTHLVPSLHTPLLQNGGWVSSHATMDKNTLNWLLTMLAGIHACIYYTCCIACMHAMDNCGWSIMITCDWTQRTSAPPLLFQAFLTISAYPFTAKRWPSISASYNGQKYSILTMLAGIHCVYTCMHAIWTSWSIIINDYVNVCLTPQHIGTLARLVTPRILHQICTLLDSKKVAVHLHMEVLALQQTKKKRLLALNFESS